MSTRSSSTGNRSALDCGLRDVSYVCRSYQFGVAQLMELAGLSCAQAVARVYPSGRAALVVAGPGNNGGDGLVLARHLVLLGFSATLFYPRRTSNPLYSALLHQAEQSGVTVRPDLPSLQVMQDWIWWIYVIATALCYRTRASSTGWWWTACSDSATSPRCGTGRCPCWR